MNGKHNLDTILLDLLILLSITFPIPTAAPFDVDTMAKGARASTKKANNVKLKSKVFGPVETDRTARLSAKLLELAAQPKPRPAEKDVEIEVEDGMAVNLRDCSYCD